MDGPDSGAGLPSTAHRSQSGRTGGGNDEGGPSSSPDVRLSESIPDHELLRQIGSGSYGEVWLGRNRLGTLRAIKFVQRAAFEDARPFEREFRGIQRFEPISRSHEGLVDILQVGGTAECFYYVMELADDENAEHETQNAKSAHAGESRAEVPSYCSPRTLRSDLKRLGRLPVAECVRLGVSLADALAHLHQHGLVHRDIKPSNIIFVNGTPKLADIGLVADVGEARSFVGTIGFIPPEGPGTPQADLYSLGKVLYECATGLDRQDYPKLPPDFPDLPDAEALVEFNEIVLRACDDNPRCRYTTAQAMHDDLALLQRGQSVISLHVRQRFWRRLRKAVLSAAAIAILLVGGWFLRNTQQPGSKRGTANSEAYDAFERGRFFWKKRTEDGLLTGARYFQTAIERDPGFAQAYAGLADCYVLLVLYSDRFSEDDTISRARTAAQRALDLDNHLVEAHTTMAFIRSTYDWDPIGAAEQFDQAVKLDPNYATAHHWRAFNLAQRGLGDAAVTSMRRALDLEPASMIINADLALMLFLARQYDSAIEQARRGIELDQGFYRPYRILSLAFGQKGMHSESVQAATKVVELRKRNPGSVIALAQVLLRQGQTMESRQLFDELTSGLKAQPQLPTPEVELAILYLMLNDREKALEHLELAWTLRDLDLRWLKLDPRVDSLRDDPRFRTLLTKMGVGQ